jgi:hypothetical protein
MGPVVRAKKRRYVRGADGSSIVPAVSCPSNKRTPNEEPWPQAEASDNGTPNSRCYSRSTVNRLIEYPSAPPMKTSDKK